MRLEDLDSGQEVAVESCLKSRSMLVMLSNGDEATGRWVRGRREGLGCVSGPRLEKVGRAGSRRVFTFLSLEYTQSPASTATVSSLGWVRWS